MHIRHLLTFAAFLLVSLFASAADDTAYTSLLSAASQLLRDGKLAEARQTATTATSLAPDRFEAWFLAGAVAHQQGADTEARPLLEKSLTLAPADRKEKIQQFIASLGEVTAATVAQPKPAGPPALDAAAQREMDTLMIIVQEADSADTPVKRQAVLGEFLDKSAPFLKAHPEQAKLWIVRAAVALELEREKTAKRAGQKLQELGFANSQDEKVRRVLAMLNRKGWLIPPVITATSNPNWPRSGRPFENSLGMKFVPVPGTDVLFSIWITREKDYQPFVSEKNWEWPAPDWETPDFDRGPTHPAVMVSWNDAIAYCQWLTERERRTGNIGPQQSYRLPTDSEWSTAAGLPDEGHATPYEKGEHGARYDGGGKFQDVYAWGAGFPPPAKTANLQGAEALKKYGDVLRKRVKARGEKFEPKRDFLLSYDDGFPDTSPVDAFPPSVNGLYDMGGNAQQWCQDWSEESQKYHIRRGASFCQGPYPYMAAAAYRETGEPDARRATVGFRCVLAVESDEP